MAGLRMEDCDGIFLENDLSAAREETDFGTAVVNITRDADIPPRYFLHKIFSPMTPSMSSYHRVSEKPHNFRLLHKDWGKRVSDVVEGTGILALLTLESQSIDEHHAGRVAKQLKSLLRGPRCELLRWDPEHLLLYFDSAEDYAGLGKLLLDEKLDSCEGFRITAIEPAVLTNPPRCYVEIKAPNPQGTLTQRTLIPFISLFSGAFTHVSVHETELPPSNPGTIQSIPINWCRTHVRPATHESRAVAAMEVMSSKPWRLEKLPEEIAKEVDFDTNLYVHSEMNLPLWGILTGVPMSGVRLMLLVKDAANFESMEQFYCNITGVAPLRQKLCNGSIRYSTFSLSPRAEFTLVSYAGVIPETKEDIALHFQIRNTNKAIGAQKLSEDHWQLRDPEGNVVVLFTTMK
ncbi:LOW QUALITY PROTEIN: uncharacterized protein [Amphiura filiformis]|uniref:LOW QUALITY PROTEIN: uncharacterized protein n=1 Tax=Amphiura filiformis TaxID=82378 RepID=UPI003B219D87